MEHFDSTIISDVQSGEGVLPLKLTSLISEASISGQVVTFDSYEGSNLLIHDALEAASGKIIFIHSNGQDTYASIGGILAKKAMLLGVKAIITTGAVRDALEIREMGLPVYYRSHTPIAGLKLDNNSAVNVPITIDGWTIAPDDYLFCDFDGIIRVEQDAADKVAGLAQAQFDKDNQRMVDLIAKYTN